MRHLVVVGLALLPILTTACDVCGIFLGIQPHDRTSTIGLLYRYRRLEGTLPGVSKALKHGDHAVSTPDDMRHRELYQVVELRADLWLTKRLAVLAAVPAVNNYSAVNGKVSADVYAVADPYAIARYLVANTKCTTSDERTAHRVMLGIGAKVPVGQTAMRYREAEVQHDQQPSTGAWDLLGSAEYSVRRNRNGAAITVIGRRNGEGADGHRMGHGISTTLELFRRYERGADWKVLPSLGAYHELAGKDTHDGEAIDGTGSSTLFTHAGLRMWWRSWGFQGAFQYAVARQLGEQMIPNRERFVLGLTYNIKQH